MISIFISGKREVKRKVKCVRAAHGSPIPLSEKSELLTEPVWASAQHCATCGFLVLGPRLPGQRKLLRVPRCSTYTEKQGPLSDVVSIKFDRQFVPPTWKFKKKKKSENKEVKTHEKRDLWALGCQRNS